MLDLESWLLGIMMISWEVLKTPTQNALQLTSEKYKQEGITEGGILKLAIGLCGAGNRIYLLLFAMNHFARSIAPFHCYIYFICYIPLFYSYFLLGFLLFLFWYITALLTNIRS
jgi:hypothetical protein